MYSYSNRDKGATFTWDWLNAVHNTVKDASKGKPFPRASTLRIFKRVDGRFEVQHHGMVIATVTPTNILTIECEPRAIVTVSRHLELNVRRKAKDNYRAHHTHNRHWDVANPRAPHVYYERLNWKWHRQNDPQVRNGSQFDLNTGNLLNPLGDDKRVVADKTASVEWLRLLREYRRGWRVRHKLGALAHTYEEMQAANPRLGPNALPAPALEAIIEQQDFSPEAVKLILKHDIPWYLWVRAVSHEEIAERLATAFNRTYNVSRDEIRKRRGILEVVPNGVLSGTSPSL